MVVCSWLTARRLWVWTWACVVSVWSLHDFSMSVSGPPACSLTNQSINKTGNSKSFKFCVRVNGCIFLFVLSKKCRGCTRYESTRLGLQKTPATSISKASCNWKWSRDGLCVTWAPPVDVLSHCVSSPRAPSPHYGGEAVEHNRVKGSQSHSQLVIYPVSDHRRVRREKRYTGIWLLL